MDKSGDDRVNSPKSGVSLCSCPHGHRGKYFGGFCLAVHTVVGENILDVRILEQMTNHFLRNLYKRPEILSDRIPISKNPGTFVRIPQKVVGHFF